MSDRDYSIRLDAPPIFKFQGKIHDVVPLNVANTDDVGYYSIGSSIVLELVGTIHTSAGPDFSSALNALRAEILRDI